MLFLAPTKPLVEQHKKTFSKFLESREMIVLTGEKKPDQRIREWKDYRIFFATPQTIRNDLKKNRISLEKVSLIIYDEAHRGVGEYAYVEIAKYYKKQRKKRRVLALTASPGHDSEKIQGICKSLDLNRIESRMEEDDSVKEYVKEKEIIKVNLDLPPDLRTISDIFRNVLKRFNNILIQKKFLKDRVRKRDLIALQKRLIVSKKKELFYFVSIASSSIKIWHCVELLEMYGPESCLNYVDKLKEDKTKAAKRILDDLQFQEGVVILKNTKQDHPKIQVLKDIVEKERKGRVIVFTQYRTTAESLERVLGKKSRLFVGQAKMTQKEQMERIKDFETKKFRVLIATSIGEEGLHIPDVETAVFFEPVPSALRMIQRRGRVGRTKFGKVYVLVTKKTIDETYYWTASRKEKKMGESIKTVKKGLEKKRRQKSIGDF